MSISGGATLAVWQQRLDEGQPRPWLARAYVRVLRYLLAQYGTVPDSAAPQVESGGSKSANDRETVEPSTNPVHLAVAALSGKPPRTGDEIRSVLQAVRNHVPRAVPGPLVDGLSPDDQILVAEFYSLSEVERLVGMLEAENIGWQSKRFRRIVQVSVCRADLDRAKPIVARHAINVLDNPKWRLEFVHRRAQRVAAAVIISACLSLFISTLIFIGYASAGGDLGDDHWAALLFVMAYAGLFGSVLCGLLLGYGLGFLASHNVRRKWRC